MSGSPDKVMPSPVILLLSLDTADFWDEMYSNLVDSISARAKIQRVTKLPSASTYLKNNVPTAIIVTDPAIVTREVAYKAIQEQLVAYVRGGGTLILATLFSSFVQPGKLKTWFRTTWNLPWQSGDYHRTVVHLNTECRMLQLNQAHMPESYSQKAVFLDNVAKEDALYLPSNSSKTQSMVFAPEPVNTRQTPVAFSKVGDGWLGYVGDVNNESESQKVVLAMCGLKV